MLPSPSAVPSHTAFSVHNTTEIICRHIRRLCTKTYYSKYARERWRARIYLMSVDCCSSCCLWLRRICFFIIISLTGRSSGIFAHVFPSFSSSPSPSPSLCILILPRVWLTSFSILYSLAYRAAVCSPRDVIRLRAAHVTNPPAKIWKQKAKGNNKRTANGRKPIEFNHKYYEYFSLFIDLLCVCVVCSLFVLGYRISHKHIIADCILAELKVDPNACCSLFFLQRMRGASST